MISQVEADAADTRSSLVREQPSPLRSRCRSSPCAAPFGRTCHSASARRTCRRRAARRACAQAACRRRSPCHRLALPSASAGSAARCAPPRAASPWPAGAEPAPCAACSVACDCGFVRGARRAPPPGRAHRRRRSRGRPPPPTPDAGAPRPQPAPLRPAVRRPDGGRHGKRPGAPAWAALPARARRAQDWRRDAGARRPGYSPPSPAGAFHILPRRRTPPPILPATMGPLYTCRAYTYVALPGGYAPGVYHIRVRPDSDLAPLFELMAQHTNIRGCLPSHFSPEVTRAWTSPASLHGPRQSASLPTSSPARPVSSAPRGSPSLPGRPTRLTCCAAGRPSPRR